MNTRDVLTMVREILKFKQCLQAHVEEMTRNANHLHVSSAPADELWRVFVKEMEIAEDGYPRPHLKGCDVCRDFIYQVGGLIAIQDRQLISIWDFESGSLYDSVSKAMSELVHRYDVESEFYATSGLIGSAVFRIEDSVDDDDFQHMGVRIPARIIRNLNRHTVDMKVSESKEKFAKAKDAMDKSLDAPIQFSEIQLVHRLRYERFSDDEKKLYVWEHLDEIANLLC